MGLLYEPWDGLKQPLTLPRLVVGKTSDFSQTLLQSSFLGLFTTERPQYLLLVLCFHERVVYERVELIVQFLS